MLSARCPTIKRSAVPAPFNMSQSNDGYLGDCPLRGKGGDFRRTSIAEFRATQPKGWGPDSSLKVVQVQVLVCGIGAG